MVVGHNIGTPPYTSDEEEEPVFVETERVAMKKYHNKSPMFFGRIDTSMSMLRLKNYMYEMEDVSEENKARLSLCNVRGEIYDDDVVVSDIIALQGDAIFFLKIRGLAGGGKRGAGGKVKANKEGKMKDLTEKVDMALLRIGAGTPPDNTQRIVQNIMTLKNRLATKPDLVMDGLTTLSDEELKNCKLVWAQLIHI